MHRKKFLIAIRVCLAVFAVAIPVFCMIYSDATGYYWNDIASKLIISISCLLVIGSLIINIKQYSKTRHIKIGTIIGMTLLLIMQWR